MISGTKLANRLKRGKIELVITCEYKDAEQAAKLNANVIKSYYKQLKEIITDLGNHSGEPLLPAIMRLPEVFNSAHEKIDELEWAE